MELAQDEQSALRLQSVPYGATGLWTLNIWFQVNTTAHPRDTGVQYLFSHAESSLEASNPLNTNQVHTRSDLSARN